MKTALSITLTFALTLSSCATSRGFQRLQLHQEGEAAVEITDREIEIALARKPQLPKPFRIGVYFKEPAESTQRPWRFNDHEREMILGLEAELKKTGEVEEIFYISPDTVPNFSLKAVRYAAAQHGADALLVINGVRDVDAYNNHWSWAYLALVTTLFVPANELEVLFVSRASLWDVRNEMLYMTAEAESTKKQTRPLAMIDEREATEAAKSDSMQRLRGEIQKMLARFRPATASQEAKPNIPLS